MKRKRREKPFAKFETITDFNKWFDKIFSEGRKLGYKEGVETTLAILIKLIYSKFDDETINNAMTIANNMRKKDSENE